MVVRPWFALLFLLRNPNSPQRIILWVCWFQQCAWSNSPYIRRNDHHGTDEFMVCFLFKAVSMENDGCVDSIVFIPNTAT
mmetsp:Transcript_25021/g.43787  ORF Transcript_25021/g.43787 Transcript_25021/m.43787 type:complete len:80 (+) Transcript_25021:156-395(+)